MNTFCCIAVILFLFSTIGSISMSELINRTSVRNTHWFEGQIDDFIRNVQAAEDGTDIQVSTCKISSQQIVATAQATAARILKGICNPEEIEDRFQNLETQLGDQMNVIKAMLLGIEDKLIEQDQELKRNQRRTMGMLAAQRRRSLNGGGGVGGNGGGSTIIDDTTSYTPPYIPMIPHRAQEVIEDGDDENEVDNDASYFSLREGDRGRQGGGSSTSSSSSSTTTSSDSDIIDLKSGRVGPRSTEIGKYNSTVHLENGKRVFSYYWIVTGMAYKINNWNQHRALRSNSFYVFSKGYRMYIKLIPKHSTSTMFLQVGVTKGDSDESLEWPFSLKMRIYLLDQNDSKGRLDDIKSRIWNPKELCSGSNWAKPVVADNPECVGLGIPHDAIKSRQFIWNDRIIVKLVVYLE